MGSVQIGRLFVAARPERIDFTERGCQTLTECGKEAAVVWNALE